VVQETDKIKNHIDTQRGKLEQDLHEIERRVTKAVDWREWFDRNPLGMMGAAVAGGFVLSLLIRPSSEASNSNRRGEVDSGPSLTGLRQSSKTSSQMNRMADTLDNTVAALLGVASSKVRDFVADVIPNFREEYREVEASRVGMQGSPTGPIDSSQMTAD
jgi:gas vesicle protein